MDQIKIILRTYQATRSVKATSRALAISKNTVRQYLRIVEQQGLDIDHIMSFSDEQLHKLLYPEASIDVAERQLDFESQLDYWVKELRRVGVTRQLLWQEYRQANAKGYGYSQFCVYLKRAIGGRDLTIDLHHNPGEKMQVDFAGKPLTWVDQDSGEMHTCQVLVAVMPHSQYTFAIALSTQKTADFVHGLNEALRFFSKLPKVILSDNLKAFVIKADRYDPDFNTVCVQLSAHYGLDLQATRAIKPKDKASVENAVANAYRCLYAPLRDRIFHSIQGINAALLEQLVFLNRKPFQKKSGSRAELFETFERSEMRMLPSEVFDLKTTIQAKVQRNYHVFLGECRNFYSVPYQYATKQATVIYGRSTVEIFIGQQRVATHERLPKGNRYAYQTTMAHMPANHLQWREAEGYDAAYFCAQAAKIGPAVQWAVSLILRSRIHEPQSYTSCLGTLRLAKKYSPTRLENAALRCQIAGKATYNMLKRILELNLDLIPSDTDLFTPPQHENIRGPQAYQ